MAPVRWAEGAFRITSLGGRNPCYYLFCGPKYVGSSGDLAALQSRAAGIDPEKFLRETRVSLATGRRVVLEKERRRTRAEAAAPIAPHPPPHITGTFIMLLDDDTTPQPTDGTEFGVPVNQEEKTMTTPKKKRAPRKAAAPKAAKPKAEKKPKVAKAEKKAANGRTRIPDDATFTVNMTKTTRRQTSKGFKHLSNLKNNEGKTVGELRQRDWFKSSKFLRDIEDGAVTIKQ